MIDGLRAGHQLLLTAAGNRFFTLSTVVSDTCSRRMFPHDEGKMGFSLMNSLKIFLINSPVQDMVAEG